MGFALMFFKLTLERVTLFILLHHTRKCLLHSRSFVSTRSIKKNRQKAFLIEKFIQISVYLHVKSERVLVRFSFELTCKKRTRIIFAPGEQNPSDLKESRVKFKVNRSLSLLTRAKHVFQSFGNTKNRSIKVLAVFR